MSDSIFASNIVDLLGSVTDLPIDFGPASEILNSFSEVYFVDFATEHTAYGRRYSLTALVGGDLSLSILGGQGFEIALISEDVGIVQLPVSLSINGSDWT